MPPDEQWLQGRINGLFGPVKLMRPGAVLLACVAAVALFGGFIALWSGQGFHWALALLCAVALCIPFAALAYLCATRRDRVVQSKVADAFEGIFPEDGAERCTALFLLAQTTKGDRVTLFDELCKRGRVPTALRTFHNDLLISAREKLACQRCAKLVVRNTDFYTMCEQAGLLVDRATGQVKLRPGKVAIFGDASDALLSPEARRQWQQEMFRGMEAHRGLQCRQCAHVFCTPCLQTYAETRPRGGRACPDCGEALKALD